MWRVFKYLDAAMFLTLPDQHDGQTMRLTFNLFITARQRNCRKVMFFYLSVIHSVHGGCHPSMHPSDGTTPRPRLNPHTQMIPPELG